MPAMGSPHCCFRLLAISLIDDSSHNTIRLVALMVFQCLSLTPVLYRHVRVTLNGGLPVCELHGVAASWMKLHHCVQ